MHDTVIRGGTIIDGTGSKSFTGDVAIDGDRIAEVGGKAGPAKRDIDADGMLVTPGWVDVHTHYDGQATWDKELAPSSWHGVTTILFGNCGVGFAPVRREHHESLIGLMEAVEEIPGITLSEGLKWDWESFPQYLDALERMPRAIDVAAQVPHHPLRVYVMGERAIAREKATADDIDAMRRMTREALEAGAFGFTTSRTNSHKTPTGEMVPGRYSEVQELLGIGSALKGLRHGAFGVNSDFEIETEELAWMTQLGQETGRPVWFLLTDRPTDPVRWQRLMEGVRTARAQGAFVTAQIAGRPVGVMLGVDTALNPFSIRPTYQELLKLPAAERLARLQDPRHARGDPGRSSRPTNWCGGCRSSASRSPHGGIACSSWAIRRTTSPKRAAASPRWRIARTTRRTRWRTTTWPVGSTSSCSSPSSATTRTTTTSSAPC